MTNEMCVEQLTNIVKEVVLTASKEHNNLIFQNVTELSDQIVKKILQLDIKIRFYSNDVKRRNVVIYGIKEDEDESWEQIMNQVLSILNTVMQMDVQRSEIDNCYRLGKRNHKYPGRPLLVKFVTEWRKVEMLKKGHKLKGRKLWVDEDYTKEVMESRKNLIPKMMGIRKTGKFAILKKDKIFVNGIELEETGDEEQNETADVNVKMKKTDIAPGPAIARQVETKKSRQSKRKKK
uniref:Uncharacterized protein n=1 Tax=Cacopsylla melanoneura TaxID=428564 RepID=A0A8D8RZP4_9HEMI